MTDSDLIREDIEVTRGRLSSDVNDLTETVNPRNVAERQMHKVSGKATSLRDRVMGSADQASTTVGDAAHRAEDLAARAPQQARAQTRGNPMAAGAVAMAAGWLVGSLLPSTQKEREAADMARQKAQPLMDEATHTVKQAAEHLKEPAQQAAESVKETARSGADEVKEEGVAAAQSVREEGQSSTHRM